MIAKLTEEEAKCYSESGRAFYYAEEAMISIFTDLTERSPTFGLSPIDTVNSFNKKSWISMFTNADNKYDAWKLFLGRRFKGLRKEAFEGQF